MHANNQLKANIDTLLRARGQTRKDLAQWCHRGESWISKIFSHANREIPLKYLDRIADFFGLATYQLFQPGISPLTERRIAQRRQDRERRIGQAQRVMLEVRSTLKAAGHEEDDRRTPSLPDPLRASIVAIVARLNDLLGAADAGRQAARTRQPQPPPRTRRRIDRRSDAAESDK